MDEFLLFISHPGVHRAPDKRVMRRSIHVLTTKTDGVQNMYAPFVPPYIMQDNGILRAQWIVTDTDDSDDDSNDTVLNRVVVAWHESNGSPISLGSCETARLLRKAQGAKEQSKNLVGLTDIRMTVGVDPLLHAGG